MTHKQEVAVVLPSSARCSLSARVQAKRRGHTAKAKKNSIRSLTCSSREKTRSAEGKVKVEVEELVAGSPPPSWRTPMATGYPTTTTGMCLAPPGLPALGASARTRRWSSCSTPSTRRPRRLTAAAPQGAPHASHEEEAEDKLYPVTRVASSTRRFR
jgi:hypothetical protein